MVIQGNILVKIGLGIFFCKGPGSNWSLLQLCNSPTVVQKEPQTTCVNIWTWLRSNETTKRQQAGFGQQTGQFTDPCIRIGDRHLEVKVHNIGNLLSNSAAKINYMYSGMCVCACMCIYICMRMHACTHTHTEKANMSDLRIIDIHCTIFCYFSIGLKFFKVKSWKIT